MSSMFTSQDSLETDLAYVKQSLSVDHLFRLNETIFRIAQTLEYDAVLQEIVDGACSLTGARYGVVALFNEFGGFDRTVTSGVEPHQLDQMNTPPVGDGLLGYLNEVGGTLRVGDISSHPRSVGLPAEHPPMTSFLGVQVHDGSIHLGNIYLGDKADGPEFTELDEYLINRFAKHAGAAISNSKKFERERKIKTDLRALVKIAPVGLVVFDARTGDVLTSNQECLRIGGAVGSDAKTWQETFENVKMYRADGRHLPVGDRPATQVLQSGEIVRGEEITLHFSDGRVVNTLINAAPIYSDRGEIVSIVVAIQDMALLEHSARMRAEYLVMVSHELRTPLTTIKGSIVALSDVVDSVNTTEPLQLLQIIDHQTDVMRSQINSLIDLSHIEAGTLALSLEPMNVSTLVSQSVREFSRNHAGFSVNDDVPVNLPRVMVDKERISQFWRNVFAHAFKYASDSSTLNLRAVNKDTHVVFSVSIESERAHDAEPPALMERIRSVAGEETIQPYLGDGLALTICKGIVEAHGGWFKAETSDCGHGSIFTFSIPKCEETDPGHRENQAQRSRDLTRKADPTRVVVAAEDPYTMDTVKRALSKADYITLEAIEEERLDEIIAGQQPDLILFDLANCRQERLDVMHRLFRFYNVPIIALLEQWDEYRSVRAFEMGADGYMIKPVAGTELVARIRATLRRHGGMQASGPSESYAAGEITIDFGSHAVEVAGQPIQLTATEYKLLYELSSKCGRVLTQDELLHRVWGPEYSGESQLLRAYIKSLRQKLGDNARNPSYIFTEHGIGYRMLKA